MAKSKLALKDFLARNCKIIHSPGNTADDEFYVLDTRDGRFFMTQSHIREILQTVGQNSDSPASLKRVEKGNIIMVNYSIEPEIGIDTIKIPVKLIYNLSEQQSFQILRNLTGILSDIEDGRLYRNRLEALFGDTADITLTNAVEGDRIFSIRGKIATTDRRFYMERYAEQVASKTLFDVAKALNGRLAQYVPEELREKFFIEGRDLSDQKIRYGEDVGTELLLSDEGAWIYTDLAANNPGASEIISKVFQQAMQDPFGLSMRHYMGKHNVMKVGKRPLVKVSGFSLSGIWKKIKELFNGPNES